MNRRSLASIKLLLAFPALALLAGVAPGQEAGSVHHRYMLRDTYDGRYERYPEAFGDSD